MVLTRKKMKTNPLLQILILLFGFNLSTEAQNLPSYVPTQGIIGWWPFNGNANNEIGNGNNGTVHGANPSHDRFGNMNKAYAFDGINDYINFGNNAAFNVNTFSFSLWVNLDSASNWSSGINGGGFILHKGCDNTTSPFGGYAYRMYYQLPYGLNVDHFVNDRAVLVNSVNPLFNQWNHLVYTYDGSFLKLYINKILVDSVIRNGTTISNTHNFLAGCRNELVNSICTLDDFFKGKIDDIGMWNRALTVSEIVDLHTECGPLIITHPASLSLNTGVYAEFVVSCTDPNAQYQWQVNNGAGFQNLNSVGQYSGTNDDTLKITHIFTNNNNQIFRCIVTSGDCKDTSDVAILHIVNNVAIQKITQDNSLQVYPNPVKNTLYLQAHLRLVGKEYAIYDAQGKVVKSGTINTEKMEIEMTSFRSGLYTLKVGDLLVHPIKIIKAD